MTDFAVRTYLCTLSQVSDPVVAQNNGTFGVRRSINVLDPENQPGYGSGKFGPDLDSDLGL